MMGANLQICFQILCSILLGGAALGSIAICALKLVRHAYELKFRAPHVWVRDRECPAYIIRRVTHGVQTYWEGPPPGRFVADMRHAWGCTSRLTAADYLKRVVVLEANEKVQVAAKRFIDKALA